MTNAIGKGTRFRFTYADSNPLWEVIRSKGRGVWVATVVEDQDYSGTIRLFSTKEIKSSLDWSAGLNKMMDESERFFRGLAVGSTVHYHNGFGSYLRCEVTSDHKLLPVALVGEWKSHELPSRNRDGSIYLGYHTEQIVNKKTFQPHASNVWEFNNKVHTVDPRNLPSVPWNVPEMTPEQAKLAGLWSKVETIHRLTSSNEKDPLYILSRILAEVSFLCEA